MNTTATDIEQMKNKISPFHTSKNLLPNIKKYVKIAQHA